MGWRSESERFGETRSSAQGNCSAKSLAGNVVDSSLSSTSHANTNPGGGVQAGGVGGGGQGTFHPPCHILHCHMVLRPEGTSHNDVVAVLDQSFCCELVLCFWQEYSILFKLSVSKAWHRCQNNLTKNLALWTMKDQPWNGTTNVNSEEPRYFFSTLKVCFVDLVETKITRMHRIVVFYVSSKTKNSFKQKATSAVSSRILFDRNCLNSGF